MRIRGAKECSFEADAHGSGVILAVFLKDPSSWSRSWGDADVEMLVELDKGWRAGMVAQLAQYHTAIPSMGLLDGHRCNWCPETGGEV